MSKTAQAAQRIQQQLAFLLEIDKLKSVLRQTHLIHADRPENSAEHSWHLALLVMVLSEHSDLPMDICRVLKMVLIHDLVEIDAGDTFCYDVVNKANKEERERRAADRLFRLLPDGQGCELRALWDEFEAGSTPEAKFANAVDRLMPLLHNLHTQGWSWQKHGITREQVLARNAVIQYGSQALWQVAQGIVDDAVSLGYLATASGQHPVADGTTNTAPSRCRG